MLHLKSVAAITATKPTGKAELVGCMPGTPITGSKQQRSRAIFEIAGFFFTHTDR